MNVSNQIHPTAIIHPKANLGQDITVGPFSVIDGGVSIGSGLSLIHI